MEVLTVLGLSASAGLNAYIPLLVVGLLARFTAVIDLPGAWAWLENPWSLAILGVLLVVEFVADKVPAVDHVNDILHTVIRPTSGGLVVGAAGWGGEALVRDPQQFLTDGGWVPMASGAAVALAVHLAKAGLRGMANAVSFGLAAPVLSVAEDATSVGLSLAALLAPILVLVLLTVVVVAFVRLRRRARQRRMASAAPPSTT